MTFLDKLPKKNCHVFLGAFIWNHPHVTCHRTFNFLILIFFSFWQTGEACQWRVCYQQGLPRLVFCGTVQFIVSKSCNHDIILLRKIFDNLRKFWTKECKTGKTGTIFMCLSQLDKVFLVSHVFMSFLRHVSAQDFQSAHFDCAKKLLLESLVQFRCGVMYSTV